MVFEGHVDEVRKQEIYERAWLLALPSLKEGWGLVVGGAGLVTAVQQAGYTVVDSADDEPEAVAQGFAPDLGWVQLAEAAYAIQRGAWHVASNLDLSLPTARGFAPGNGSLVGAVRAATGVVPDSAGKPAPTMGPTSVPIPPMRLKMTVSPEVVKNTNSAAANWFCTA